VLPQVVRSELVFRSAELFHPHGTEFVEAVDPPAAEILGVLFWFSRNLPSRWRGADHDRRSAWLVGLAHLAAFVTRFKNRRHAFGIPIRPAFHGRCLDARTNRAARYRLTVAMTLTVPSRDSFLTRGIQSLRRSDFTNQYSSTYR
jgi:hypothetical protein